MDSSRVIASSLSSNELALAFSELVADRWDNWDLSPFMAYLVDICAPEALPYLADQFDVDGLQGFAMADDLEQKRDIIKRSISLHKYIGTPWAIREACRTVGFPVIVLEEGVTAVRGGEATAEDWARFRVLVDPDNSRPINSELSQKVRTFIEFYKNERSHLVDFGFLQKIRDTFRPIVGGRDNLSVATLVVHPNPITLNPAGAEVAVDITVNVPWQIERPVYEWPDGSGDLFALTYTGEVGKSSIVITSDPNTNSDREKIVEIRSTDGDILGTLTIRQRINWNAYSRAYNYAYNTFKINAYDIGYSSAYGKPQSKNTKTEKYE